MTPTELRTLRAWTFNIRAIPLRLIWWAFLLRWAR